MTFYNVGTGFTLGGTGFQPVDDTGKMPVPPDSHKGCPYIRIAVLLAAMMIIVGCAAGRGYDSIPIKRDSGSINAIMDSIYKLRTETVIKTPDGGQDVWAKTGIGLAIAPDLILALNHVVSMDETNGSILSETTYLVGPLPSPIPSPNGRGRGEGIEGRSGLRPDLILKTLLRDRESDVALFMIDKKSCINVGAGSPRPGQGNPAPTLNCLNPLPIPFGSSSELRIGDIVYLMGNAFRLGLNVRQGIVSALIGQAPSSIFFKPERTFMISNGVVPGDSGGPVLSIRDGRFELVGLAQGMIAAAPNLGIALKIEVILERIKDYWGEPFIKGSPQTPFENFWDGFGKTFL